MSDYIKGRQIPVASSIARKLEDMRMEINKLSAEANEAGLNDDANAIDSIREHLYDVASKLERKAREAYCAARRGEELPS